MEKIPSHPYFYIYPAYFYIYRIMEMGREAERGVSRTGGILFIQDDPILVMYYKIRTRFSRHTIYPLLFLNIN
jgi:hypothetical protein